MGGRWEGMRKKAAGVYGYFKVSKHLSGGRVGNTTKNPHQDSCPLGQEANPGPPEHEAGALTAQPQSMV